MPVTRDNPVHFGGKTLSFPRGPTPSDNPRQRTAGRGPRAPETPAPRRHGNGFGSAAHTIAAALFGQQPTFTLQGKRSAPQKHPFQAFASGAFQGFTGIKARELGGDVRHPLAALARNRAAIRADPAVGEQRLLRSAINFGALGSGVTGGVVRRASSKGLATSLASFSGDLSRERFMHGAPVPIRGGIKGFSLRARNPEGLLGSGVYANSLPKRPNEYAQMTPGSTRNMAPWQQARFKTAEEAYRFAQKQADMGRDVKATGGGTSGSLNIPTMWVKRVVGFNKSAPEEIQNSLQGNTFAALLPTKVQRRLGTNFREKYFPNDRPMGGDHFLVEHRAGNAPSMIPLGVKPGTNLFDLRAPILPGEATRAKELLARKLKLGRAAIERDWTDSSPQGGPTDPFGGKGEVKGWASTLLPQTKAAFDDLERLAQLHASGELNSAQGQAILNAIGQHSVRVPDTAGAPLGAHLHQLIDSVTRGTFNPTATAFLDRVPRDQQHILDNPNTVLRQMGYQGLIDPQFGPRFSPGVAQNLGVGDESAKEIVMFDKNRLEPFHETYLRQHPHVKQSYPVVMAQELRRSGAPLVQAIKSVRQNGGQVTLPLSDELHLNIVKIGNQVRFFAAPAKHPDAVGQELNGAQALQLAHRSIVQRQGGTLSTDDIFGRAYGMRRGTEYSPSDGKPDLARFLKSRLPELDRRWERLYNPAKTTEHHEVEQRLAMGKERRQVQLRNMHALFDQGPVSVSGVGGRAHLPQEWKRVGKDATTGKPFFRSASGEAMSEQRMLELLNSATSVNGKRFNFDSPDKGALGGLKLRYQEGEYPPSLTGPIPRPGDTQPGIKIDKHGNAAWIDFMHEGGEWKSFVDNGETPIRDKADVADFMRAHDHAPKIDRGKQPLTMKGLAEQLKERGTETWSSGRASESGVRLPPEGFFNHLAYDKHGVDIGAYAKPPRWYEMMQPGTLKRLLDGTPGDSFEQKAAYLDKAYQPPINKRWEERRKTLVDEQKGNATFRRIWGGDQHTDAAAGLPLHLRDAFGRAKKLGLSGQEARVYIREYLQQRKRLS